MNTQCKIEGGRRSGRYPWPNHRSWMTASDDVKKQFIMHLREKGMPVDTVAKRIGISIEEAKKYYGD